MLLINVNAKKIDFDVSKPTVTGLPIATALREAEDRTRWKKTIRKCLENLSGIRSSATKKRTKKKTNYQNNNKKV